MKNGDSYNLTAKQAAETLGRSVTTIHRYISKGKLNAKYVNTDHGREVRLKESEVERLAEGAKSEEAVPKREEDLFSAEDKSALEVGKLLERYERALYRLGKLTEKLKQQKQKRKERINRLEEEKGRLQSHLQDKAALIESLKSELSRPLTLKERLSGKRNTNH